MTVAIEVEPAERRTKLAPPPDGVAALRRCYGARLLIYKSLCMLNRG
ncbi:hypothetical protein Rleg_1842 [Rhizobium leguminosarum bv. trifolii WSM1325]|uniref:Uncharacterized protein n=1 Tax=Rhizobium leguminosarum bv. trifolii (strain WSM1325) TaxID=395491 RepID=C6AX63_RHILS|nr:hypothetical protein Rleg_1842 [Rhizobium leguminosarum bv. trifolii WSM1325]